jgi:hypothetical protein
VLRRAVEVADSQKFGLVGGDVWVERWKLLQAAAVQEGVEHKVDGATGDHGGADSLSLAVGLEESQAIVEALEKEDDPPGVGCRVVPGSGKPGREGGDFVE